MFKNNQKWMKYLLGGLLLGVVILFINHFNVLKGSSPQDIKTYVQSFGVWSPVVYVIILSLLPLLLFPDSVIVIAGGMVFGLTLGTLLTIVGAVIGSAISFYIARLLGREVVQKLIKTEASAFQDQTEKNGFWIVLMLRLIPLFPFKVVSYSAGLSNVKFWDFLIATTLGSLPGIIVYVNLGDKTTQMGSRGFYMAIGLLILLFACSFVFKKIYEKKKKLLD